MTLLLVVPWILTVVSLLFILIKIRPEFEEFYEDEDEDEPDEEESSESKFRVAMYQDKAYWVHRNVLYESELVSEPNWATARPVQAIDLPTKEVNRLLKVLDDLQKNKEEEE